MITSDATLLDIALEAGFGSHEAFTRAFEREYGQPPSRWRERAAKFQLSAANNVHFHPPGGLRLPARHRMGDVELVRAMVEHHVWLVGQLVERADRLSAEQLDELVASPDDADPVSLRWLLSRVFGQMAMWNAAVDDAEYDFAVECGESASSMARRLSQSGPEFVANVARYSDEGRLDETFVDAFSSEPRVLSYGAMIAHVLTFGGYHRLLAIEQFHRFGITDLGLGDPKDWFDRES